MNSAKSPAAPNGCDVSTPDRPLLQYLESFSSVVREAECADGQGRAVSTEEAFRMLAGLVENCASAGGQVLFIGNGGSAAIANHVALDFSMAGIRASALTDSAALTCVGNDHGYVEVFAQQIIWRAQPRDLLIASVAQHTSRSGRGAREELLRGHVQRVQSR